MKGSLILLLSVLFIAQSLPVKDHKSHGDLRRLKRHSLDRHSIADREVRTIISAIVDAILDGDRKKRSDIPEDDENTVEEDDDEEENFQGDIKENQESENSESGNSQIEEHSSILEINQNIDKSAKILNNTNSVSRSVIDKIDTLNNELLEEGKSNSINNKESDSEFNSDFEIESGSAEDSGYDSGSTQDEPEWDLHSVESKSLISNKLDAGRMKRDEEGQVMKAEKGASQLLKVKDDEILDNNVSAVNTEKNKIIIVGSGTESGFTSGDDSDFESGTNSNVLIQDNVAESVRKLSSEREIEKRHTIHKNDNENAKNIVFQGLKSVNIAESGSGHSSGDESGSYGKSARLNASNENTINKRSVISVEEGFNDQISRIHQATVTNSFTVQKNGTLTRKKTPNHPIKDKEAIEQPGDEYESGSGSIWDGSSGYGLGSGGEKREKVYFKSVREAESDEAASIAAENASGSGSGSGSATGLPKLVSEENIRSNFSEISQKFQVNGNKTKSSDGNVVNNTNVSEILNVTGNHSEILAQNLNYKIKTINNESLKNITFTNQKTTSKKDEEEDQVPSNKNFSKSVSTGKVVSSNSYQNDAANEDSNSSAGSGDKNDHDENSNNDIFSQTFNQTKNSTKDKNDDKKETLLKVVSDMAKAADESIQADDSDSVVKKSKIIFPDGKSQKKLSLMENKFEDDLKEKNTLSVDHALKSLVLQILKEDPSLKSSLKMLTHKRKVEEKKLQDQILRLVIHEQFKKQKEEAVEKKVTNEIKDFEGLVETLSQTESLTPTQHEIISRKLERDLLNHLSIPKKHGPELLKQEFELLKSSEMEFVKEKIEDVREKAIEYATKHKGKMEDIRKFAIAALKPIVESLPLKKEDIEGLAKLISKSAWLKMITHTKPLESKAERKGSHVEPLEIL